MELVGAAATEEVEGVGEFWDPQSNNILYFIPPISTLNITLMPLPLPLPPPLTSTGRILYPEGGESDIC